MQQVPYKNKTGARLGFCAVRRFPPSPPPLSLQFRIRRSSSSSSSSSSSIPSHRSITFNLSSLFIPSPLPLIVSRDSIIEAIGDLLSNFLVSIHRGDTHRPNFKLPSPSNNRPSFSSFKRYKHSSSSKFNFFNIRSAPHPTPHNPIALGTYTKLGTHSERVHGSPPSVHSNISFGGRSFSLSAR